MEYVSWDQIYLLMSNLLLFMYYLEHSQAFWVPLLKTSSVVLSFEVLF